MALAKTVLKTTPHSITYLLTEDANAVAELAINVIADCATGPLKTLLQTVVADEVAARVLVHDNCDLMVAFRSCGAAEPAQLCLDFDDAATVFEMNALGVKVNTNDVFAAVVTLRLRHSLVK